MNTYLDAYENVIVDAITNIMSTYELKRNWEGDPCLPQAYTHGLVYIVAIIVLTPLE